MARTEIAKQLGRERIQEQQKEARERRRRVSTPSIAAQLRSELKQERENEAKERQKG